MEKLLHTLAELPSLQRTILTIALDALLVVVCFFLALVLRHGEINLKYLLSDQVLLAATIVTIVRPFTFFVMGLYKGIWRFASTHDLVRLFKGTAVAIVMSMAILFVVNRLERIPRSSFVIDWCLLMISLGGMRFTYRLWRDGIFSRDTGANMTKVIIVGAGDGGERVFREIRNNPSLKMKVVAFIDDDPGKKNKVLHGVKIYHPVSSLKELTLRLRPNLNIIALPSATESQLRTVVENCQSANVEFKTLPKASSFSGHANDGVVSRLRPIEISDLLGREEVTLDTNSIGEMIYQKVIFISGAGGSIGSELTRQIAKYNPLSLVTFELNEFNHYKLEQMLKEEYPHLNHIGLIGDVRDAEKVNFALAKYTPHVILHAAAYKHVPIMENNPKEAVHTNIVGTHVLTSAAIEHRVERFVMISTDKAVNPTNIMGTSKRIAEMVCQNMQKKAKYTKFLTVRFGNVLGSSGSVIPLFKEQISNGGPLTVTHKDITRYFMSIPEASRLVLQAATIGLGGEIFVLDMANPVKIYDLAVQMIHLSGKEVDKDIKIQITGLRPGEKLYEELFINDEDTLATRHPRVKVAKANTPRTSTLQLIQTLTESYKRMSDQEVASLFKAIVPEFTPSNKRFAKLNKYDVEFADKGHHLKVVDSKSSTQRV
jgi:FlaA1/EpsC-like NDP-sugar epimerase